MRRKKVHHWQRVSTAIITVFIVILLWPFFEMKEVKELWLSTRFAIPSTPHISQTLLDENAMPKTFVIQLNTHDPKILAQLQQGGWPAYLAGNKIEIGPYLERFRSEVDLNKIRQITPVSARIKD